MKSSNIGYEGDCYRCANAVYKYVGETSLTGLTQIREHLADYRGASVHIGGGREQGGICDFKFSVSGKFRKCLHRQVDEGLRIQR